MTGVQTCALPIYQSGGSFTPEYLEISQGQFFDPVKRLLKFIINKAPAGKNALALYDRKTKTHFDVVEDNKTADSNWTYQFRWKYENCGMPYDIDTGWMNLNQYALSYGKTKFPSDTLNIDSKVKKLDIFWRVSIESLKVFGMNPLASLSLSSLKGDAQANDMTRTAHWNCFNFSYGDTSLDVANGAPGNILTIPNYLVQGSPPLSGLILTGGSGFSELRICAYKEPS